VGDLTMPDLEKFGDKIQNKITKSIMDAIR